MEAFAQQLLLGQPAFDKCAGINTGRRVAPHVNEIAAMRVSRRMPEMSKADIVKRRSRLEACDVAAELRGFLVGAQNDCNGIPSNDRTDAVFNVSVPVGTRLALRRDRINVGVFETDGTGTPTRYASSVSRASR